MTSSDRSHTDENNDGYAGDISPNEAWQILESEPGALLVDVRTTPEWNFVGLPDLADLGKDVALVQWQTYPDLSRNDSFERDVEAEAARHGAGTDSPLIFLCRSGQRSRNAAIAMTGRGYRYCYNLAGGFEGDLDDHGHRGRRNGWKVAGLPWKQR